MNDENKNDIFEHLRMLYDDDEKMLGRLLTMCKSDFEDVVDRAEGWAHDELLIASGHLFNDYCDELEELINESR